MRLKEIAVGRECFIKPEALKGVKKTLGYTPKAPFEVLDHDIDNTTILASLNSDDDGRSFAISSDTIAVPKENREWKRISKSSKRA